MLHCGLLGETLGHSYSPMIHHELGDYDYRLFEVPRERLGSFLTSGSWDGLNVTIPYKKAVVSYCTELSSAGRTARCTATTPIFTAFSIWCAAVGSLPPERRRWCWAAAVHPLR